MLSYTNNKKEQSRIKYTLAAKTGLQKIPLRIIPKSLHPIRCTIPFFALENPPDIPEKIKIGK
jgi:hypothetical protein